MTDKPGLAEEEDAPRFLDLEPWVWMNSLVKDCEAIIRRAVPVRQEVASVDLPGGNWRAWGRVEGDSEKSINGEGGKMGSTVAVWYATTATSGTGEKALVLIYRSDQEGVIDYRAASISFGDTDICALEFFDDLELALVLRRTMEEEEGVQIYLATIDYPALMDDMVPVTVPDMALSLSQTLDQLCAEVKSKVS
jgi:hypothetical protein